MIYTWYVIYDIWQYMIHNIYDMTAISYITAKR